jgi:hypothetical protein
MSVEIGRQGYLGFALESVAGTAESAPSVFLPFTECSLETKHEKFSDISVRASRVKDHDSVSGKKWGEGDVSLYLDATNSGYLIKLAFGNESKADYQASPNVDNHQFYITTSGNAAKTATIWEYQGSGPTVQRYVRTAANNLEIEVGNEGLATLKTSLMGSDSTGVTAPSLTTTSGTIFAWTAATVSFGDTVEAARIASATKVTNFKFTLNNNLEMVYEFNSATVSQVLLGEAEVTGSYTLFFENDTELSAYKNNTKRAMVMTLTGASVGAATEQLEICIDRMFLEDKSIDTGASNFFAITGNYRVIQGTNGGFVTVNLRNAKTSVY